jgi:F0F1-type ATP synthase assembly protein I
MDNDRIAGSAKDFAGKVESAREAAEKLRDGSKAVAKKVEDYPLGGLLVGVGIGFALALLIAGPPHRPLQRRGLD